MLVRHRTFTPVINSSVDRAFEQLTNSFFDTRTTGGPSVDGRWVDEEFVVTVDLPGVPASAVTVEITGETLLLGAETDAVSWKRSLHLGERLDAGKVAARHVDGRLTVRIGTVDEPEPRRIAVESIAPEAIETQSTDDQSTDTNDAG